MSVKAFFSVRISPIVKRILRLKTSRGAAGGFLHLIQIRFPLPVLDPVAVESRLRVARRLASSNGFFGRHRFPQTIHRRVWGSLTSRSTLVRRRVESGDSALTCPRLTAFAGAVRFERRVQEAQTGKQKWDYFKSWCFPLCFAALA